MNLTEANLLATRAHRGQKDKLGDPYIWHVRAVANGLTEFGPEIQIAGLLHDVVEDTDWTLEGLLRAGVPRVSVRIVDSVTKRPGMTPAQQVSQAIRGGRGSILVKCSDNAHNTHPDRVARLSSVVRERLERKYRAAREALWLRVDPDELEKILSVVNPSLLPEARKFRRAARPDISNKDVALRWLAGESTVDISTDYDCTAGTISKRLRKAREEFPELPWDGRRKGQADPGLKTYVEMNDGKAGTSRLREGSVVRGRGGLRRGM